jgi:hypothetical protein
MKMRSTLVTAALLCPAVALPDSNVLAQQKQQVSFKVPGENSRYIVSQNVDVRDAPNRIVRLFNAYHTVRNNAATINTLKLTPETLTNKAPQRRPTPALLYFDAPRFATPLQLDKASSAPDRATGEYSKVALPYWDKGRALRAAGKAQEAEDWGRKAAKIDDDPSGSFVGELVNPLPSLMKALQASEWRTFGNRLSFKETVVSAYGLGFDALAFNPADYRVDVIESENETGATVQELRRQSGAILVVNGGFFDIDQSSLFSDSPMSSGGASP